MKQSSTLTLRTVAALLLVNLFYSTVSIATKFTSMQEMLSLRYFVGLAITVLIMGLYAVLWQQILKKVDITLAYMFKATGVIYVLLYSAFLFNEGVTSWNIIGASIIIIGILLFVKAN